jgi:hypothetical protein
MEILSSDIKGYYYYRHEEIKTYNNNNICIECKICKCSLNEPSYEQKKNNNKITLPVNKTIGKCGHIFHTECINEWTKTKKICPIDFCPWKLHIIVNDINDNNNDNINGNINNNNNDNSNNNKKIIKKNNDTSIILSDEEMSEQD